MAIARRKPPRSAKRKTPSKSRPISGKELVSRPMKKRPNRKKKKY